MPNREQTSGECARKQGGFTVTPIVGMRVEAWIPELDRNARGVISSLEPETQSVFMRLDADRSTTRCQRALAQRYPNKLFAYRTATR